MSEKSLTLKRLGGQCKMANILAELNLVAQCNVYQEVNDVGKSVQVNTMFNSYNVIVGDAIIPTNTFQAGSKKEGAVAKKRIITKVAMVPKTSMVMMVHSINQVLIPEMMNDKKKKETVTETMKNKVFKWSQHLFLHWCWTSHKIQ